MLCNWTCVQTLRTTLELSPDDEDKLKLYQEAKELQLGLPGGSYPDRELQWLVTTCWNRGAHQASASVKPFPPASGARHPAGG